MICKYCNSPQDNINYVFCDYRCQWLHYQIKEKMNHLFDLACKTCNGSKIGHSLDHEFISNNVCALCSRGYLDHTAAARCQSCNKCGLCNVVDNLLLCDNCAEGIKSKQYDLIEQSRSIDSQLRGNQDFHNAATVAIIELKQAIMADATITNKDEALKAELLTRYEHFAARVFDLNNEVYEAQLTKSVIRHNLDQIAHLIRNEERERIKIADANYVPPVRTKPVKAKLVKNTNSELDKFEQGIRDFAKMNNCSETEARLTIIAWYGKMGKKVPE